jgi:plasmid maintenance system killer protein
LGVAVYRTLGVGLGFNFDHDKMLEENEEPSTRRLQARAAKAAIRRVQELYDTEGAQNELDGISDQKERDQKKRELRQKIEEEEKYFAKRLSELVPTGPSKEFKGKIYMQGLRVTDFIKTSSHEYTLRQPPASVTDILKKAAGRGTSDDDSGTDRPTGKNPDFEFIEAYEKYLEKKQQGEENDDDDGDTKTVLV